MKRWVSPETRCSSRRRSRVASRVISDNSTVGAVYDRPFFASDSRYFESSTIKRAVTDRPYSRTDVVKNYAGRHTRLRLAAKRPTECNSGASPFSRVSGVRMEPQLFDHRRV
jgi:hypothetical protein